MASFRFGRRIRSLLRALFHPNGSHPLLANTLNSGGLFVMGDFIQQTIELHFCDEKKLSNVHDSYDLKRSARLGFVGLAEGPPHHYFYLYLDKFFPGKGVWVITKKILLDQFIAAPFFAFQFFMTAAWLEGKSLKQCWDEFVNKFPAVYLFDWVFWPPIQALNFLFIPTQYRVLYVNAANVVWDVFLSYMKHQYVNINMKQQCNNNVK